MCWVLGTQKNLCLGFCPQYIYNTAGERQREWVVPSCIKMPAGWHRNGKFMMPLLLPFTPTAGITNQSWNSLYLNWDITLGFFPAWPSRQPLISGSCHVQGHTCASPGVDSLCWGWKKDISMGPYLLRFQRPAYVPLQSWTRSHREGVMPFETQCLSVEESPWLLAKPRLCWWSLGVCIHPGDRRGQLFQAT